MLTKSEVVSEPSEPLNWALSIWENEGGGVLPASDTPCLDTPDLTNTELVHLRVRVIALENLMIAVLAEGSDRQRQLALDLAGYISPRHGSTQHPLTLQAARQMTNLIHRADHPHPVR